MENRRNMALLGEFNERKSLLDKSAQKRQITSFFPELKAKHDTVEN